MGREHKVGLIKIHFICVLKSPKRKQSKTNKDEDVFSLKLDLISIILSIYLHDMEPNCLLMFYVYIHIQMFYVLSIDKFLFAVNASKYEDTLLLQVLRRDG